MCDKCTLRCKRYDGCPEFSEVIDNSERDDLFDNTAKDDKLTEDNN